LYVIIEGKSIEYNDERNFLNRRFFMAWGKMLVRTAAGFTGKAITFIFAVFCVITGLLGEVSAQTGTGTVRNRADFSPVRNIQVIMREVICPVYGMNLSCSIGPALDTTTTGINGVFTIGNHGGFLTLTDIDSMKNGSFQPRSIMQPLSMLTGPGSVLYMVPKNTTYPVRGKALSSPDNLPINGIRAVLSRSTPVYSQMPPYTYPDLITPLDTVFSDANGLVVFACDTEITKAIISVSDIDSVDNGGRFLATSSGYFSPINDTATTIISMNKDLTPVSRPLTERVSSTAPVIRTIDGVVSVALRNWQPLMHAQVLILDARGVTVARLQPSAGGIVKWYTSRVPCGIYCLCLEGSGNPLVARLLLP
jgi:hypothetical protein